MGPVLLSIGPRTFFYLVTVFLAETVKQVYEKADRTVTLRKRKISHIKFFFLENLTHIHTIFISPFVAIPSPMLETKKTWDYVCIVQYILITRLTQPSYP